MSDEMDIEIAIEEMRMEHEHDIEQLREQIRDLRDKLEELEERLQRLEDDKP